MNDEEMLTVLNCLLNDISCCRTEKEALKRAIDILEERETKMEIKDSGERREFSTGAVRDCATGKGRNDLLPINAIMDLSKHCENGALKYGEGNVRKGIPAHCFFDSGMRHLMKWFLGWKDEDHLVAAAWNIMWLLEQRTTHPELDDVTNKETNKNETILKFAERPRCANCVNKDSLIHNCMTCNNFNNFKARR